MARRFGDQLLDDLNYGSDASIDGFAQKTVLAHVNLAANMEANDNFQVLGKLGGAIQWSFLVTRALVGEANAHLRFQQDFDGLNNGDWDTADNSFTLGLHQVGCVYDRGSNANDPTFYIDGDTVATVELLPPLGNSVSDAEQDARSGPTNVQSDLGCLVYVDTLLSAAAVNRHRWWGMAPGGPSTMEVWHPFYTDSLVNKGTAVANAVATGTEVVSMVKPMRPGCGGGGI